MASLGNGKCCPGHRTGTVRLLASGAVEKPIGAFRQLKSYVQELESGNMPVVISYKDGLTPMFSFLGAL